MARSRWPTLNHVMPRDLIGWGIVAVVTAGALLIVMYSRRLTVMAGADFAERHPTISRSGVLALYFGLAALAGWRALVLVSSAPSTGLVLAAAAGLSFGLIGIVVWAFMSARNFRVVPLLGGTGFAFSLLLVAAGLVALMPGAWPKTFEVFSTVTLATTFVALAAVTIALWRRPIPDSKGGRMARAIFWAFGRKPRF